MKSKYPGLADAFCFNHAIKASDLVGVASVWNVSGWLDALQTSGNDIIGADRELPDEFQAIDAIDSAT